MKRTAALLKRPPILACSLAVLPLLLACSGLREQHRDQAPQEKAEASWMPAILSSAAQGKLYLPDYSYAGYSFGELPLPSVSPTLEVTDFGAAPDDRSDDTPAFRKALEAASQVKGPVVLHLPKGRFIVRGILFLERSKLVLQGSGSGPDGTVLEMPTPLADLERPPQIAKIEEYLIANDKRKDGVLFSPFSWTGGLIWTRHPDASAQEKVTFALEGKRGSHSLTVQSGKGLRPNQVIRINWYNRDGEDSELLRHVFALERVSFGERLTQSPKDSVVTQIATVSAIQGEVVTLKQPLLHDVTPRWGGDVTRSPMLQNVGIEHLRIEFPSEPYAGHHHERGYNALYLNDLVHSWVRDLVIVNADSGVLSDNCAQVTIQDLRVTGRPGHYGIHLGDVCGVIARDFAVDAEEEHTVSFNTKSRASVFAHGSIIRPTLDQHRGANHQNLFDDISASEDRGRCEIFKHGGADYWGPTHGAFNTFWNIRLAITGATGQTVDLGSILDAGPARIVGLAANADVRFDYPSAYQEGIGRGHLGVPSLYEYQLKRRLQPSVAAPPAHIAPSPPDNRWSLGFDEESWLAQWLPKKKGRFGLENLSVASEKGGRFSAFLRASYPRGSSSPSGSRASGAPLGGGQFLGTLPSGPRDHLFLRFFVRFESGFDFVKGGKLPGLYGGTEISGGRVPDGTNGFSTRFMWRARGAGELYLYAPTSEKYGTSLGRGNWAFAPGKWQCLEQEIALNTPGSADGIARIWFEGAKVYEKTDVLYRTTPTLRIEGVFFSTFFGGADESWATPRDTSVDFSGFTLGPERIGCAS